MVGDEGLCTFCKIIPRGPIYQSEEGTIVCSTCKDSKEGNFQQNDMTKLMEKLLSTLPRSCKFKKNGCKRTMDIQSIEYHEEDCEHRDIQCVATICQEILPASSLFGHLKTVHEYSGGSLMLYMLYMLYILYMLYSTCAVEHFRKCTFLSIRVD